VLAFRGLADDDVFMLYALLLRYRGCLASSVDG
jgi:hypothetical protein